MKKIILKTALITLVSVIVALGVAFGVASLAFPQSMATMFENMGNYAFATGYASLAYNYSHDVNDLYRCVDDSIRAGNDKDVTDFAKKLTEHEDFAKYCDKDENAGKWFYVYSNYCVSLYNLNNTSESVLVAEKSIKNGFTSPNAVGALTLKVVEKGDEKTAEWLLGVLPAEDTVKGEANLKYYNAIKNQLEKLTKGDKL